MNYQIGYEKDKDCYYIDEKSGKRKSEATDESRKKKNMSRKPGCPYKIIALVQA